MFTGIVETTLPVVEVSESAGSRRLALSADWKDAAAGQSIAVNGCCLTIARLEPGRLWFDVIHQTLQRTNLGRLARGDRVNVERPLRPSDRLDGHFVQGHVDGPAILKDFKQDTEETRLTLETTAELAVYLVPRGSVAIDGVSLTLAAVRGNLFEVALIPTTLERTTLSIQKPGWPFNLETDILTRTVVSWLQRQKP